ncbi:hypothetical protein GCM10010331_44710 [Streptomyces xanthochromogenes]|uniref:hypothetical protein n=1 Tax=Streptomyces xanthochromogenes TaxID=67384 RepID=UPI0016723FDE|nr:hypothetical protein [Streptomyces xanthochromogenes]GHB52183.1 hypothetical protein GCM10010331_44710 [Streptomyces xanthochromogenes]
MIIERLETCFSRADAVAALHSWAEVTKRMGQAPRYGVKIGKKIRLGAARSEWPIYLVDNGTESEAA